MCFPSFDVCEVRFSVVLFSCTRTTLPKGFGPYKKTDIPTAIFTSSGKRNLSYLNNAGPIFFSPEGNRDYHDPAWLSG